MENAKCHELYAFLSLKTYPFGVKFYESIEERPEGTTRPRHPMNTCQITSLARYYGRQMYFTADDMACVEGAVALGLAEETENMKSGKIAGMLHADLESARRFTQLSPRIPFGRVKAVAVAPLCALSFEPDIVVAYGNTAQIMKIIQGYLWKRGGRVDFSTGGEWSLCSDVLAQAYNKKDIVLGIPCFGDRKTGLAQDDELTIGFPRLMLEEIMEGIKATAKVSPYPIPYDMGFPQMPDYTLTPWAVEYRRSRENPERLKHGGS